MKFRMRENGMDSDKEERIKGLKEEVRELEIEKEKIEREQEAHINLIRDMGSEITELMREKLGALEEVEIIERNGKEKADRTAKGKG